jgi:hypothetical protein
MMARTSSATRAFDLVEGFENVDDLGDDQVGQEQFLGPLEKCRCATRLSRRVAGQVPDQDVRVEEGRHARAARD